MKYADPIHLLIKISSSFPGILLSPDDAGEQEGTGRAGSDGEKSQAVSQRDVSLLLHHPLDPPSPS